MRLGADRPEDRSQPSEDAVSRGSGPARSLGGVADPPGGDGGPRVRRRWARRGRASLSSHIRAASLAGVLLTGPASAQGAASPAIRVSGEVLVVGEDGTLLLDGERGLEFLVLHPDAEVRDFRSEAPLARAQIRPGDLVEYTTEVMAGLALVSRLVVTPLGTRLVVTTPIDAWTASQAPRAPPDRRRRDAERRTEIAEWGDRLPDPRVLGRHVLDLDPEVLRRHRSP